MSSRENSVLVQSCIDYERPGKANTVGLTNSIVERANAGQRSHRANSKLRQLLDNVQGSTSQTTEAVLDPAQSGSKPQRLVYNSHQQKMRELRNKERQLQSKVQPASLEESKISNSQGAGLQNSSNFGPQGMNSDIQHLQNRIRNLESKISIDRSSPQIRSESRAIADNKASSKHNANRLDQSESTLKPNRVSIGHENSEEITINNIEIEETKQQKLHKHDNLIRPTDGSQPIQVKLEPKYAGQNSKAAGRKFSTSSSSRSRSANKSQIEENQSQNYRDIGFHSRHIISDAD